MKEKGITSPQLSTQGSESTLPISPKARGTALAPPPSDTANAGQLFAQEAGRLPGVLKLERWGEAGTGAPTFHVYLRPDDRDTESALYEVKGQVYDRYPETYLDVVVLEATDSLQLNCEPTS